MKNITAISTHYGPLRLRSRVEARWCVFFDAAGIRFNYEWEGYALSTGGYLPDFWLPELHTHFEVKGAEATAEEVAKCAELADRSDRWVLLAEGPPEERANLRLFLPGSGEQPFRYVFARDRFTEFGFWLVSVEDGWESRWLGPNRVVDGHKGGPMFSGALTNAYIAAASARFERQDRKRRQPPIIEIDPDRYLETVA